MKRLLSFWMALLATTALWAFQYGDLFYRMTSENTVSVISNWESYSSLTSVTIPEYVTYSDATFKVTGVGNEAFFGYSNITSVTLPATLESIGYDAFRGTGISSITIPESLTYLGSGAFTDCCMLKSVVWNAKACRSGSSEWNYRYNDYWSTCDNTQDITSFTFGKNVEVIPVGLCTGLSSLTSIVIPSHVVAIETGAFSNCSGLTTITIPNSVKTIGYRAFYNCSALNTITLGNSVDSIGSGAFLSCSNLKTTYFTGSMSQWCNIRFADLTANPLYVAGNLYVSGKILRELTIPSDVQAIRDYVFAGSTFLSSVTIGNNVKAIGNYAFYACSALTTLQMGNAVTDIGDYALAQCTKLPDLTIGNSVVSIGEGAFSEDNITSVTLPSSVKTIGADAFSRCGNLTRVDYTGDAAGWCGIRFGGDAANPVQYAKKLYINGTIQRQITVPATITSLSPYAFINYEDLTAISIPNSVTSIGAYAFSGCSNLSLANIPNNVTEVVDYLFNNCEKLTDITIPDKVTTIGAYAFCNTAITAITIPESVTYVESYALSSSTLQSVVWNARAASFGRYIPWCERYYNNIVSLSLGDKVQTIPNYFTQACEKLSAVTIPASVTSIGEYAFPNCTEVNVKPVTPPAITSSSFSETAKIYVPCASMDTYQNTEWVAFNLIGTSYAVTLTSSGHGTTAIQSTSCTDGTATILATADDKYMFYQWSDGNTDNPRTIQLTRDTTLTAIFEEHSYQLPYFDAMMEFGDNWIQYSGEPDNLSSGGNWSIRTNERVLPESHAHINVYNNYKSLLVSPYIDLRKLAAGQPVTLSFDVALTACNSSQKPSNTANQTFAVLVSTDGTWNLDNGWVWNDATGTYLYASIPADIESCELDLSAFAGSRIRIGFYAASYSQNGSTGDNDIHLRNIRIRNAPLTPEYKAHIYGSCLTGTVQYNNSRLHDFTCISDTTFTIRDGYIITVTESDVCGTWIGWNDGVADNQRTITISSDTTIYPRYNGKTYAVSITANENGSIEGGDIVREFNDCTRADINVCAVPNHNCYFISWSDGYTEPCRTVYPESDTTLVANFGAYPPDEVRGKYGPTVYWALDTVTGLLTVTGEGAIERYYEGNTEFSSDPYRSKMTSVHWDASIPVLNWWSERPFDGNTAKQILSFTFGEHVDTIPEGLCSGMEKLTSIDIPDNVLHIAGDGFLGGCDAITSVTIGKGITRISKLCFVQLYQLQNITMGENVEYIEDDAFQNCYNLTHIQLPDKLKKIGNDAFFNDTNLVAISLPDGLLELGESAFQGTNLTTITIPSGLVRIGHHCFVNCPLDTVIWNVRKIEHEIDSYWDSPFYDCSTPKSLILGEEVEKLPNYLFYGLNNLHSITTKAIVPPPCAEMTFSSNLRWNQELSVNVPCTTKEAYMGVSPWSMFNNIREPLPDFAISLNSNDTLLGTAVVSETDCEFNTAVITAVPEHACEFVQWTDGNTDNPRSISLTQDTTFTAIFTIPVLSGQCGEDLYWSYADNALTVTGSGAMWDHGYTWTGATPEPEYTTPWPYKAIKSVTLPENLTTIGDYAFAGCENLAAIVFPDELRRIGEYAFASCASVETIGIPDNVQFMGDGIFQNCSNLNKVVIGKSVKRIPNSAFAYCESLKAITLPTELESIGGDAFVECRSLAAITLPVGITTIAQSTFHGCRSLKSITIPDNVTRINGYAFRYCDSLQSVTMGNNVTSIGDEAFRFCHSLSDITLSENLTEIGRFAFYDCRSLSSITIPQGVTTLAYYLFAYCGNLQSVTIPESVSDIQEGVFVNCENLTAVTLPAKVTTIAGSLFRGCINLSSVGMSSEVDSIAYEAFYNCRSLSSFSIPERVTSIEMQTFYGCSSLTSVIIPDGVTGIEYSAFNNCTKLQEITIPDNVVTIDTYAFADCDSLRTLVLGKGVKELGNQAFGWDYSLQSITSKAATPPVCTDLTNYVFSGVDKSIPVYVPNHAVHTYKSADVWNEFTNYQVYCEPDTMHLYHTICGTSSYVWSDSLHTTSGDYIRTYSDIYGCDSVVVMHLTFVDNDFYFTIDSVNQTATITALANDTLTDLVIPRTIGCGETAYSVVAIADSAFIGNTAIQSVTLSNDLQTVGIRAFAGCTALNKVTFGSGIQQIGAGAFEGCRKLFNVYCYSVEPPVAEPSSFTNYNVRLYVPCDSKEDYELDMVFGSFKFVECIGAEPVAADDVTVETTETTATFAWPTEENAHTYSLTIKKQNVIVRTLIFNAQGQLTSVVPLAKNAANYHATISEETNGYMFTVTDLDKATHYTFNLVVRNVQENVLKDFYGEFDTKGISTKNESIDTSSIDNATPRKVFRDGQVYILRDGKTYTLTGEEVE